MNAKRALLASLAVASCFTTGRVFADAADFWIEYREAHGLPTSPTPSNPPVSSDWILTEMSRSEGGPAYFARTTPRESAKLVSANANGYSTSGGSGDVQKECSVDKK